MLPERYMPKKISQISKTDKKISIVGKVVEISSEAEQPEAEADYFILDDDGSKIKIFFEKENSEGREKIEKGKLIRAFCMLVGEQLKLDIAQDLSGLDLNLLKTVDELYSKANV